MRIGSPFPDDIAFAERAQDTGDPPPLALEEEAALGGASSPRRRAQFALGRACAREALQQLGMGQPGTAAPAIGRTESRQPRWPEGTVGSITHSHEHAAAVAALTSRYRGLGVDLERERLPSDPLLERVARPAERAAMRQLPPAERSIAFTALFAAKESLYKAVNPLTGIYLGFMDAEVMFASPVQWSGSGGPFTWRLEKHSTAEFPVGATGVGAWRREGEWVIAGVWIPVA